MKIKLLNWIYKNNKEYFDSKPLDLDKIFESNKQYFELLFIKDFIGYIPKEINEPALKIFEDYAEMFERWTLWQSWYINRKALRDVTKIQFYDGMLVYLKLINSIARANKKLQVPITRQDIQKYESPKVEDFIDDINYFRKNAKIQDNKNQNKASQDSKDDNSQNG